MMWDDKGCRSVIYDMVMANNYAAKKRGAVGDVIPSEFARKLEEHGLICHYCNADLLLSNMTIDHMIPVSRGGQNMLDNVVPACSPCNRHKYNKMPDDFLATIRHPLK